MARLANYLANGAYFTEYMDWTDDQWKQARENIKARTDKDKAARTAGPSPAA